MREDWIKAKYKDFVDYIQPTKYLVDNTDYHDSYDTPVLTAGKTFILGYTKEKHGIFNDFPVIIFDDFTTASKFVNFRFKAKSSAMKILKPTSKLVNINFIYYTMQMNQINTDTHKRYWISIYSEHNLLTPPLLEQKAIVSRIEQLFSELDNGIENLKIAQQKLKIYRQAVLKKAFEGKLTEGWREKHNKQKVQNWKTIELREIVTDITQGWSPKCINKSSVDIDEWAVIKTSAIQYSTFLESENKLLPNHLEPRTQHELKDGDILITRAGPRNRVGVCCLIENVRPKLINCDKAYRLRLNKQKILNKFFILKINSHEYMQKINLIKTGGNDSGLNLTQSRFLSLEFSLPSIEEQNQILQEIDSKLSVYDNIDTIITNTLQKSEALRQSILKKAFKGELLNDKELEDIKNNLEYESAEKLLKRIKKKRDK